MASEHMRLAQPHSQKRKGDHGDPHHVAASFAEALAGMWRQGTSTHTHPTAQKSHSWVWT